AGASPRLRAWRDRVRALRSRRGAAGD
ncbi:hypothetical protein GA0115240_11701, partial [Streptomyces sp. DvalAA-14]